MKSRRRKNANELLNKLRIQLENALESTDKNTRFWSLNAAHETLEKLRRNLQRK